MGSFFSYVRSRFDSRKYAILDRFPRPGECIKMLGAAILTVAVLMGIVFLMGLRIGSYSDYLGNTGKFIGFLNDGTVVYGSVYLDDGITVSYKPDSISYSDGSYYKGSVSGFLPDGTGILYDSSTGSTYSGDFTKGKYNGKGTCKYKDGSCYEGDFFYGLKEGFGKITYKDGSVFEGYFLNDEKSGSGTFRYANGDTYIGNFEHDMRSGTGRYEYADGTIYIGSFANNLPNGNGICLWTSGVQFSGTFKNGVPVQE